MVKKISVVINTYNRASTLDETLSSLYYLEYPNFEVIVINGPSTDNTEEVLKKYKNDIKIATTNERNLSVSRNIGIAMASGEYIAYIDDDAIPDRFWLNKLIKGFNSNEVAGVGGDTFDRTGVTYQARRILSDRLGNSNNNYIDNSPATIPNAFKFIGIMSTNSIYRRDMLLNIGGYDEQYDYYLDETDLCTRIVNAGYYINYQKGADVYHKFSPSFMRGELIFPLDYSSIVKNLIYYCYQYKDILEENIIEKELERQISGYTSKVKENFKNNLISRVEYINALDSINIGIKQGKESVKRGYKLLISEDTLDKYKSSFKKFPNFFNDDFSKKKTIVLLTHNYYPNIDGGIASLVYNTAINLSKRGHNVHVITKDWHKYENSSVTFEKNIWVHRIKQRKYDFNFLRPKTHYDIDITETNIHILSIYYTIYEEIVSIVKKYKVNVVHNFLWENLNFYAIQDEQLNCITTLVTPAVYMWVNTADPYRKFIISFEKFCIENNKNLIADSQYILDFSKKSFNLTSNPKLIYLGLEDGTKDDFKELTKNNDKIEILFLGRFEYRKGIDLLLKVIPDICKKYDNVVFRLVGENTTKIPKSNNTYLEKFLEHNDNSILVKNEKVIIEGAVDSVAPYYKNCDIFVAPSRFESFGLIYLEAMMFSKPTIGTNTSAIPEVIKNNVTGLLAEPEDESSLKDCLIRLIEDKQLRESMGLKGRERYEELFTADIMTDNLLKYYEEVIENKKI